MTSRHGEYDYREFVAEYYDTAYEAARQKDLDFFVDYARRTGGRTLELGCGTGRVLIPTATAGCEITGLDMSSYMLKICREKLSQQPAEVQGRVKLVQGDMTDFDTGETYSLVTTPFRPFQHLITVDEQKTCLNCANHHLFPGGLLILDLFDPRFQRLIPDPQYMSEIEDVPEMKLPGGRLFRRTNRTVGYHREQQYNDIGLIYYITHPDGRQERLVQAFPFRYFFRYEVVHLLELCGFRVVDIFGDYDHSPLSNDSAEMIFVAEKRE